MAFNVFRKRVKRRPATDPGERIYAIGDVHGRYDLLRILLDKIEDHAQGLPDTKIVHIVLLGDLIDRGPGSAAVLRFLYNVQQHTNRLVILPGNHEEMMLKVYGGDGRVLRTWLRNGGVETLQSFGIDIADADADAERVMADMQQAIPRPMMEWLSGLPLSARSGDYLFCHAGIRPGIPLKRQHRADLLWIRDEFLEDRSDHGAVIVHGHSVSTEVEMLDNRIGIDTGAYRSGVLTGLYLEGRARQILRADDSDVAHAEKIAADVQQPVPLA